MRAARESGHPKPLFLSAVIEDIAHPPHGMDQLPVKGVIHLGTKPADMDIHHVGVAVEIHVPDLFREKGPGQNVAGPGSEKMKEGKFLGREVELRRPDRWVLWLMGSISRSAIRRTSTGPASPRRRRVWTRAKSSAKAKGFTK
jgi:hypothetical protein